MSPRLRAKRGWIVSALVVSAVACGGGIPKPDAEFLVVSADSTFWVTVANGTARIRGVPMLVSQVDGRLSELYVVDDDHSFFDAVFVGHRLFARDLERGDIHGGAWGAQLGAPRSSRSDRPTCGREAFIGGGTGDLARREPVRVGALGAPEGVCRGRGV